MESQTSIEGRTTAKATQSTKLKTFDTSGPLAQQGLLQPKLATTVLQLIWMSINILHTFNYPPDLW